MATGDKVFARRSMTYGGQAVDSQQVIELKGLLNDQKLLDLEMLIPIPKSTEPVACGECGAQFLNDGARERHGRFHHETQRPDPYAPRPITEALRTPDMQNAV